MIKKMLKLYKIFCKVTNAIIIQMRMEKISLKKFLYFRKISGFGSLKCLCRWEMLSAKHILTEDWTNIRKRNKS